MVVDNSSAFRLDDAVPLIIPEINGADAAGHQGILANPNCTTAVALMALAPLHRAFGVRRVFAASYQAVSGSGARAIEELRAQVAAVAAGRPAIAGDLPAPDRVQRPAAGGYVSARWLHARGNEDATRGPAHFAPAGVPRFGHLRAGARLPGALRGDERRVRAPGERWRPRGRRWRNNRACAWSMIRGGICIPMPLHCAGRDDCEVGRLRLDCAFENGLAFWVAGDQLLKGAALNAVQIAELLLL